MKIKGKEYLKNINTENDKIMLIAIEYLLEMTDESDWHLFHATVRRKIQSGENSREFEKVYQELVDKKLRDRGVLIEDR